MKNYFLRITIVFIAVSLIFSSCWSTSMNVEKMNIKANYKSGKILNLRNYGDSVNDDLLKQSEKIMRSGFLNTTTDEYGYYELDWGYAFKSVDSYMISLFIFPFLPLGVPLGYTEFTVVSQLRIFDSNGNLVWQNRKNENIKKNYGMYYGKATGKGASAISKLLTSQMEQAAKDVNRINAALERAGPITEAKSVLALEKIANFKRN